MPELNQACHFAVALDSCHRYDDPGLPAMVGSLLDKAEIRVTPGTRVLVKPNLLQARPLACSNPEITGLVCAWLLDHGAIVSVADSPGFGNAARICQATGLAQVLKKLGLALSHPGEGIPTRLDVPEANGKEVKLKISRLALETDMIFSVARVKAHCQTRLTLCVKNCFGCVPGMNKAFVHARHGASTDFFAACLAALWAALPPVAALADGIVAMHVTGPSRGEPFNLGVIGASNSAPGLDRAILDVLKVDAKLVPLQMALEKRAKAGDKMAQPAISFPVRSPGEFNASGFIIPEVLKSASFSPARLFKSCLKRMWKRVTG